MSLPEEEKKRPPERAVIPTRISYDNRVDVINAGTAGAHLEIRDQQEAFNSPIAIYAAQALLAKLNDVTGADPRYVVSDIQTYAQHFHELLSGIQMVKEGGSWLHDQKFDEAKGMAAEAFAALLFRRLGIDYRNCTMGEDLSGTDMFVRVPSKDQWLGIDLTATRHADEVAKKLMRPGGAAVLALPMGRLEGYKTDAPRHIERIIGIILRENYAIKLTEPGIISAELIQDVLNHIGIGDPANLAALRQYAQTIFDFNSNLLTFISRPTLTEKEKKKKKNKPVTVAKYHTQASQKLYGILRSHLANI